LITSETPNGTSERHPVSVPDNPPLLALLLEEAEIALRRAVEQGDDDLAERLRQEIADLRRRLAE
jgi:hypothetical protein